jgi:hypothetical protein
VPFLLLGVIPLRDPEFEVGDRHDLGVSDLAGGLSGEGVCLFVSRRALMPLDPYEINGPTLAAQFAYHVSDVPG